MRVSLVAISGPHEGEVFVLAPGRSTVGRHSENDIRILGPSVSRQHCDIEVQGEKCHVRDLDSRHGTFVNHQPVAASRLAQGDLLTVCDTTFRLLLGDEAIAQAEPLWLDQDDLATKNTRVEPVVGEEIYTPSGELLAGVSDARSSSALSALLRLPLESAEVRNLEAVGRKILPLILETVPAERAVLLLPENGLSEFETVYAFRAAEWKGELSRTVTTRSVSERVALLWNRGGDAGELAAASIETAGIWSVLAVPLPSADGEPPAILYLDSRRPEIRFDEAHLHVAMAFAGLLAPLLACLRYQEWLDDERLRLQAGTLQHDMVGQSAAMEQVLGIIARVAATDSTALIGGESGTGKELAARAIHRSSDRANRPFVAINCAALSETLLESELFGHERGAFTGADRRKIGKVETSDTGTLFLDEVGELPLLLQAKLLRFLQEREFERVGGTRPIRVDVRLVAATNRDLAAAVRKGAFREDLYHRLNVISVLLPPLRERSGDIPLLAAHFAAQHCARLKRTVMGFTRQAHSLMKRYHWPGNVRELANAVERAVVLGDGELIRPEDLPESLLETDDSVKVGRYHDVLRETKKKVILGAMREASGRYTEAARILGLNSNYLHRLMRNLQLKPDLDKTGL